MRKIFKVYDFRLSTSTVLYSINPVIFFLISNSNFVLNYFQRNAAAVLHIIFKNDIAKRFQIYFFFQIVKFYDSARVIYKYNEYKTNVDYISYFFYVLNSNKLCVRSCIELGCKFEAKLFDLNSKKFGFFYFFTDYLNYLNNRQVWPLVNKIFNKILNLQLVEYFEDIWEMVSQNHVGSLKKKR
jgi:hypothetical protein